MSVTVRQTKHVKAAIATIADDAWTTIKYPTRSSTNHQAGGSPAPRSPRSRSPRSPPGRRAEQVPGRLVVRRIPDLNPKAGAGQATLFDTWRFHAFFTTTATTWTPSTADKTHRGHAIIEQVHADLKNSALAHLPSGKFTANAAWLVLAVIAFNLTRAAATLSGPRLAKATTAHDPPHPDHRPRPDRLLGPTDRPCTYRPAWPWQTSLDRTVHPQPADHRHTDHLTTQRHRHPTTRMEHPGQRGPAHNHAHQPPTSRQPASRRSPSRSVDRGLGVRLVEATREGASQGTPDAGRRTGARATDG